MGQITYGQKQQRMAADISMGHIGGGGLCCHGISYGNGGGGDDNDGRGMGGSPCQEIVVVVSASGFGPAVMTEQISIWRQGRRRIRRESGERTAGKQRRDSRDGGGKMWPIFCSTLSLGLIATQSTLLILDLEFDLINDENDARYTHSYLRLGRGIYRPLQVSAGMGGGGGGCMQRSRQQGYHQTTP